MRKTLHTLNMLVVILVAGCGGYQAYEEETFHVESPFREEMDVSAEKACNAAKSALLNQGYRLENSTPDTIRGTKDFQPEEDKNIRIEFNVVCKNRPKGSLIFATAVQSTYRLNETSQSASVGFPYAGSISLPVGKTKEALDKISAETISDEDFYSRFYRLLRHFLNQPDPSSK